MVVDGTQRDVIHQQGGKPVWHLIREQPGCGSSEQELVGHRFLISLVEAAGAFGLLTSDDSSLADCKGAGDTIKAEGSHLEGRCRIGVYVMDNMHSLAVSG
ncbi:USP6 like protein [Cricetulus griseus]|nr:USP6 like protein [Cricetulus griseus]